MKRVDQIMNMTLGDSSKTRYDLPPKRKTPSKLHQTEIQQNLSDIDPTDYEEKQTSTTAVRSAEKTKLDIDLHTLPSNLPSTPVLNNMGQKDYFDLPVAVNAEKMTCLDLSSEKKNLDINLPVAPLYSPLAPAANNVNEKKDLSPLAAPLSSPLIMPLLRRDKINLEIDSPVDPSYSPLTPAAYNVDERNDLNPLAAPLLSPSITPFVIADKKNMDIYSPVAPSYSPLTPAANNVDERNDLYPLAAPLLSPYITPFVIADSKNMDIDSPVAPSYSPLTPAAKKLDEKPDLDPLAAPLSTHSTSDLDLEKSPSSSRNSNIDDSPLPAMSPSTLELYNTLAESVNINFIVIESPLIIKSNHREPAVINTKIRERTVDESTSSSKDLSPDTSLDYVPNSDEETDDDGDIMSRRRPLTISAMVHNIQESSSSNEDVNHQVDINATTISQNDDNIIDPNPDESLQKGRSKKGRKRQYLHYTLAERKQRKYANLPYQTKTKTIEPKVFKENECKCKQKCSQQIPLEKRKEQFEKYISLKSYEAQLLFILNNIKEVPKKRTYTTIIRDDNRKSKPKTCHRIYSICDQKVCKDMFLNTFQITNQKVTTCLKKLHTKSFNDKRGVFQGGWNKTPQEDVEFIKEIINALPKYESHYKRAKNSDVMYLQTGMTVRKIYELYTEKIREVYGPSKTCVSLGTLKKIFYTHFNLRCKVLKSDTCNKCDVFANKINNAKCSEEKEQLIKDRDEHQTQAEKLREQMNEDLKRAKTDEKFECLTFDLEKTLPLPRLSTSIIFYKRQLWLYNSGIHAGSNDSGHCYIWVEGEAGRGAQEVGSCLIKFIKTKLSEKVEHLVLWSDCCGGQNRNIKIILMLKALLHNHAHLKTITFKYLESGHTWLPNDTDFSKIETQLKFHDRIYTPNEYMNVIRSCRKVKPLNVYKMQKEDFFGTSKIEKNITNRKTYVNKEKVNWLKTKEILLQKQRTHALLMRNAIIDDDFKELNIEKKLRGQILDISDKDFVILWPDGKEIAQAKLDDLRSLYDLIPRDCLPFYESLKGSSRITDDIDGFGGIPDFNTEEEIE